jgi:hypothetical protein
MPGTGRTLSAVLARLRGTGVDVVPATAAPEPAAASSGLRLAFADPGRDGLPRCLVSLLGPLPGDADRLLGGIVRGCRDNGDLPVVVLSELRPDLAVRLDGPVDFVPSRHHLRLLDDGAYRRYATRRWETLLAKWSCVREIQLGLGFDDFIDADFLPRPSGPSDPGDDDGERAIGPR